MPAGVALASAVDLRFHTLGRAALAAPLVMAIYYLGWTYAVGFFNKVVGLR